MTHRKIIRKSLRVNTILIVTVVFMYHSYYIFHDFIYISWIATLETISRGNKHFKLKKVCKIIKPGKCKQKGN